MSNVIHPSFKHGKNFTIGNFCTIEEGVEVGDNVSIGHYVLLKKGTKVGQDVFIDSYVRSSGNNYIGDNVTLRYGATIAKEVTIRNGAFISPNVMTIYSTHSREAISGTEIGEEAYIGTAAVLGPGVKIGSKVVVGAMSYANCDCLDSGVYVGVPAKKKK